MVLSEAIILWKFILQATQKYVIYFLKGEMHIISKLCIMILSRW